MDGSRIGSHGSVGSPFSSQKSYGIRILDPIEEERSEGEDLAETGSPKLLVTLQSDQMEEENSDQFVPS